MGHLVTPAQEKMEWVDTHWDLPPAPGPSAQAGGSCASCCDPAGVRRIVASGRPVREPPVAGQAAGPGWHSSVGAWLTTWVPRWDRTSDHVAQEGLWNPLIFVAPLGPGWWASSAEDLQEGGLPDWATASWHPQAFVVWAALRPRGQEPGLHLPLKDSGQVPPSPRALAAPLRGAWSQEGLAGR